MCRRCGEADKRGSNRDRRARKLWMLRKFGDGITCPCSWCGKPLGYLDVTSDRLEPGGSYRHENVVPSCAGCQVARQRKPIPDGCQYG